jgi:hypothetical protein
VLLSLWRMRQRFGRACSRQPIFRQQRLFADWVVLVKLNEPVSCASVFGDLRRYTGRAQFPASAGGYTLQFDSGAG